MPRPAAALPMIFVGALIKLLASGRVSGAGAALAGFGLVLFGLTRRERR
jgi:phosphate:Na+ symporter